MLLSTDAVYAQAVQAGFVVDYWWLIDSVTAQIRLEPTEYPVDAEPQEE